MIGLLQLYAGFVCYTLQGIVGLLMFIELILLFVLNDLDN